MSVAQPGVPAWIDLTTSDPAGAAEFYGALFGWTLAGEEGETYRLIVSKGRPLGGVLASDAEIAGFGVYLRVRDMDTACAAAADNGGAVVMEPISFGSLSRRALMMDPSGALVGAWEPGSFAGFDADGHGVPVWFELFTGKLADTATFYAHVFEWDLTAAPAEAVGMPYLTHGEGHAAVAGMGKPDWLGPERAGFWRIYIQVDDVDAVAAKVGELGGKVIAEPGDTAFGRLATCLDPQGAVFQVVQPPSS
jgi:predicted enzyme related to lactoylglutathione lyase